MPTAILVEEAGAGVEISGSCSGASRPRKAIVSWICLAFILGSYVFSVESLHPANYFGGYNDDAIYLSSAQALAQGRGYIIPSFPGAPPQTKYPILYPWLLSWVWKVSPHFPQNLGLAVHLTEFFGCWFLLAAFFMLRRFSPASDAPPLLVTAICAFHPLFLSLSGFLLSDVPFCALALTAVLLADSAMRRHAASWLALLAGILAALSVGMRTVGVAFVAGILLAALVRRTFRQAVLFCLALAPCTILLLWPTLHASLHAAHISLATGPDLGWRQNLAYYTSYGAIWRVCVPNARVFFDMLVLNLRLLAAAPSLFLMAAPSDGGTSLVSIAACLMLTAAMFAGIVRHAREAEWKPIHFAFPVYALTLLVWPYPVAERLILPFLVLFLWGLWVELCRLAKLLRGSLRPTSGWGEKAGGILLASTLLALVLFACWRFEAWDRVELQSGPAQRRASLRPGNDGVYEWIRSHTPPEARFIAYDDALLYLCTGRQAISPLFLSSASLYTGDESYLKRDLAHLADSARVVGAPYWLTTRNDFNGQPVSTLGTRLIAARMDQIKSILPVLYESPDGRTEVLDLSCLAGSHSPSCGKILAVLFPYSH